MPVRFLSFLWSKGKPEIYELVITQDGLSLEGNEKLGAHIEDILHYVEKKADEIGLNRENVEVFIRSGDKVLAIKRMEGLGVAVVGSSLEEAEKSLKNVESRVKELLQDKYEKRMEEFRKSV